MKPLEERPENEEPPALLHPGKHLRILTSDDDCPVRAPVVDEIARSVRTRLGQGTPLDAQLNAADAERNAAKVRELEGKLDELREIVVDAEAEIERLEGERDAARAELEQLGQLRSGGQP